MKALSRFHKGFGSIPITHTLRQVWNRSKNTYEWKNTINEYRLVTLTTPESFAGDLNHAWRLFRLKCRRTRITCPYFGVREYNVKRTAEHLHMVFRTCHIDYADIRKAWTDAVNVHTKEDEIIDNVWFHIDWIEDQKGSANYLSKYLFKEYENGKGLRKYWYSQDWIYSGHASHGKELYLANYKPMQTLEDLRTMDKHTRYETFIEHYHYMLCIWYSAFVNPNLTTMVKFDVYYRLKACVKLLDHYTELSERLKNAI